MTEGEGRHVRPDHLTYDTPGNHEGEGCRVYDGRDPESHAGSERKHGCPVQEREVRSVAGQLHSEPSNGEADRHGDQDVEYGRRKRKALAPQGWRMLAPGVEREQDELPDEDGQSNEMREVRKTEKRLLKPQPGEEQGKDGKAQAVGHASGSDAIDGDEFLEQAKADTHPRSVGGRFGERRDECAVG